MDKSCQGQPSPSVSFNAKNENMDAAEHGPASLKLK
jgi:hypothetical protein